MTEKEKVVEELKRAIEQQNDQIEMLSAQKPTADKQKADALDLRIKGIQTSIDWKRSVLCKNLFYLQKGDRFSWIES